MIVLAPVTAPRGDAHHGDVPRRARRHTGPTALILAASLLGALVACAGDDSASDVVMTYETMPRLALIPGTTFCASHDDEGCQFVDIDLAAVGPDGRVALFGGQEVSQFDSAGSFVRLLGRVGGGPGEYRSVMAMAYDSAATLTIYDLRLQRLVRLDSAGQAVGTSPARMPPGFRDAAFADGRLVFAEIPGAAAIGDPVDARFLTLDSAGAATIVLGRAPTRALATGDGSMTPIPAAFTRWPRWGIGGGGGLYFVDSTVLRVVKADSAGARVLVDMDVAPPPVTAGELDSARQAILQPRGGPVPPQMAQALRQSLETSLASAATVHPMISILAALDDGTLWARETVAAAPDSVRWNGFDADGRPLGYILLPTSARIHGGQRDRLLLVTHDAEDVPSASWYAVRPGVH